jgi:hypothetical protein
MSQRGTDYAFGRVNANVTNARFQREISRPPKSATPFDFLSWPRALADHQAAAMLNLLPATYGREVSAERRAASRPPRRGPRGADLRCQLRCLRRSARSLRHFSDRRTGRPGLRENVRRRLRRGKRRRDCARPAPVSSARSSANSWSRGSSASSACGPACFIVFAGWPIVSALMRFDHHVAGGHFGVIGRSAAQQHAFGVECGERIVG